MARIDLKTQLKSLYSAGAKRVTFVDVPSMKYLMIDGTGDPNDAPFQEAVSALYTTAYTMKFMLKKGKEKLDYPVMALEALWWMADDGPFDMTRKADWRWTAMIVCPDAITSAMVESAKAIIRAKKDGVGANLDRVRFETWKEGPCAQILHVGPYAGERDTIARLHAAIGDQGCAPAGKHHEIYLSDPRRAKPEKLKTILRTPVRKNRPR